MFQNNKKIVNLLIVTVFAIFLAVILALYFSSKKDNLPPVVSEPAPKIFTQEEISEALSKKADQPQTKLFTDEQISKALNKKIPPDKGVKLFTPEEIQEALQAK